MGSKVTTTRFSIKRAAWRGQRARTLRCVMRRWAQAMRGRRRVFTRIFLRNMHLPVQEVGEAVVAVEAEEAAYQRNSSRVLQILYTMGRTHKLRLLRRQRHTSGRRRAVLFHTRRGLRRKRATMVLQKRGALVCE